MTGRRDFVRALAVAAGLPRAKEISRVWAGALTVAATPTIFSRHPEGSTTLVRFVASDVDAPAGRLRVFDMQNRLLGTAGMLGRGDRLLGELWLQMERELRIRTELEMPGTRRPIRTWHTLRPKAHWSIYWITVTNPDALRERFSKLGPLRAGVEAGALMAAGVRGNPCSLGFDITPPDHEALLTSAMPATKVAQQFGLPVSPIALVPAGVSLPHLDRVLQQSGGDLTGAYAVIDDGDSLSLSTGLAGMASQIESRLTQIDSATQLVADPSALIVGSDPDRAIAAAAVLKEWNANYAYPQIMVGSLATPIEGESASVVVTLGPETGRPSLPDARALAVVASEREATRQRRARTVFDPLANVVSPTQPTLEGIAERFSFPVAGTLVFNPAPFGRSGMVEFPDGSSGLVTDVPGLGYAFVLGADGPSRWMEPSDAPSADRLVLENSRFRLRVDANTGGISSIVVNEARQQIVRAGDEVNGLSHGTLVGARRQVLPDLGERLILERAAPGGTITTTVTLIDTLPWIEIANQDRNPGTQPVDYEFALAGDGMRLSWEVAGGVQQKPLPVEHFQHLRWLSLATSLGTVFVVAPDTAYASARQDGRLVAHAPHSLVRFRIGFRTFALSDDPWRFGWASEPLIAITSPGRGDADLPSFGRMLEVRDPGTSITAIKPADDGIGVIVWLQELLGVQREVAMVPGLLRFSSALHTDSAERDTASAAIQSDGSVAVPLEPYGLAALRLLGIRGVG